MKTTGEILTAILQKRGAPHYMSEKRYNIIVEAMDDYAMERVHNEIQRASKFEVLLEHALHIIHEYSISGIHDKEWRKDVYNLEQEIKTALKDKV